MIYLGSRYQSIPVGVVQRASGGVSQFVLRESSPVAPLSSRLHTWCDTDRIDLLADKYLGLGSSWWKIMDANPEITDPAAIPIGTVIRIPSA